MKNVPDNYENIGGVMTNFDRSIDREQEILLRQGDCYGEYYAWDFFGMVWYEDCKFYCAIKRYQSHVATLEADSLDEIMDEACDLYGNQ